MISRLSSGTGGVPGAGADQARRSSVALPGCRGPVTLWSVHVISTRASARLAPIRTARRTRTPSAVVLLLLSRLLGRRLGFGASRRFALRPPTPPTPPAPSTPAPQRGLSFRQDAIPFLRADQAPTDRVPDQLFGILHRELSQSGGTADRPDERVRHRTP